MDPIILGATAIAVLMAKKSAETASEVVTKDVLEAIAPTVKTAVGRLAAPVRDRVSALGDRLLARLPAANRENPFEDVALLEAIVVEEVAADPAVKDLVDEVAPVLPAMTIENWKGINIKGGTNTVSGNTLNF